MISIRVILLSLLLVHLVRCTSQKKEETHIDSVQTSVDSVVTIIKKEITDPNVYEIPADYPWLMRLIGQRFPWDSASVCSRALSLKDVLTESTITKEKTETKLFTTFTYGESYLTVIEESHEEMQECSDNICKVVLTSDWLPIGMGLNVGMSKSDFLQAIRLKRGLTQNIFNYTYKPDDYNAVTVVFEFENDLMSYFSYEVTPCFQVAPTIPYDPFFIKLFNKPFITTKPDSVLKMIKGKVNIKVERDNEELIVDKISESDMYPQFLFDSSSISFKKWPQWQIVNVDLKSPQFGFINGIKVGMMRAEFLELMGEKEFEGDGFTRSNPYCNDGFKSFNDLVVSFKDGLIIKISYSRSSCN
jgi:hypothetical protein